MKETSAWVTRRCTATNRAGERCKNIAAPFLTICRLHGAMAPQMKEAQRLNMIMASEPAVGLLTGVVNHVRAQVDAGVLPPNLADGIRAAMTILDRCGLSAHAILEVTRAPEPENCAAWLTGEEAQLLSKLIDAARQRMERGEPKPAWDWLEAEVIETEPETKSLRESPVGDRPDETQN